MKSVCRVTKSLLSLPCVLQLLPSLFIVDIRSFPGFDNFSNLSRYHLSQVSQQLLCLKNIMFLQIPETNLSLDDNHPRQPIYLSIFGKLDFGSPICNTGVVNTLPIRSLRYCGTNFHCIIFDSLGIAKLSVVIGGDLNFLLALF